MLRRGRVRGQVGRDRGAKSALERALESREVVAGNNRRLRHADKENRDPFPNRIDVDQPHREGRGRRRHDLRDRHRRRRGDHESVGIGLRVKPGAGKREHNKEAE